MPSRTIFVANIPFETSEEQLAHVFAEAGPVQGVEIKFDNEGKPRGYAFVQFYDEAAADSAVRNLTGVQVNGRQLRVELSSDTPNHRQGGQTGGRTASGPGSGPGPGGRGGPGGGGGGGRARSPPPFSRPPPGAGPGYGGGPPPGPPVGFAGPPPPRVDLGMVPPGQDLPRGENAMDQISRTLASVSPGQMQDVMAGMKTLISTQPDQARQLLSQKPQLAYALFQAMLLMNIVDPQVLQHVKPVPAAPPPGPAPGYGQAPPGPGQQPNFPPQHSYQPPQQSYQQPPGPPQSSDPRLARNPANSYRPPAPGPAPAPAPGYGGPPQPPALSPQVQAMLSTLPEDQRSTLMSVLQMTPDQINALDQTQQQSVMQLRQQFLGV